MSNCLNSCEYQCPYFKDLKRSCPNPSGLKPETAIQGCAEIVSRTTLESPSRVERDTMAAQEIAQRSGQSLWETAMNRNGVGRRLRKVEIPQESDLEL